MDDFDDYFADMPDDIFSGYTSDFAGLENFDSGTNTWDTVADITGPTDIDLDWGMDTTPSNMSFDGSLGDGGGLAGGILSWVNGLTAADKNLLAQALVGGISGYQKSKADKAALNQRNKELEQSALERQRDRDATAAQSEEAWKRQMSLRQVPTNLSQPLSILDFGLSLPKRG